MTRNNRLAALTSAAASGALFALAPAVALAETPAGERIASDKTWTLQSHTTKTYRMPIDGLGTNFNVLEPCYGFELNGPGVNYAAANLSTFGVVFPEAAAGDAPDGGIPGASRQADGSYTIPESAARVTADDEAAGAECKADGWRFVYDRYAAKRYKGVDARAARRSGNLKRRAVAFKSSRPIQVLFAGLEGKADGRPDLVVKIATGELNGTTKLSTHARVLPQD